MLGHWNVKTSDRIPSQFATRTRLIRDQRLSAFARDNAVLCALVFAFFAFLCPEQI
jgi:hypothetical protein